MHERVKYAKPSQKYANQKFAQNLLTKKPDEFEEAVSLWISDEAPTDQDVDEIASMMCHRVTRARYAIPLMIFALMVVIGGPAALGYFAFGQGSSSLLMCIPFAGAWLVACRGHLQQNVQRIRYSKQLRELYSSSAHKPTE